MMGRVAYLVAGAALGGYVVHKLNRTVRAWSPEGIAGRVEGRVGDYRAALTEFNEDVRAAADEAEADLRRRYAPGAEGPPARPAIEPRGATDAPDKKDGH